MSHHQRVRSVKSHTEYDVPGEWKCFFCGGKSCKYEPASWERWERDGTKMAIRGLYSTWVTDDILALARPSKRAIEEHRIVDQFLDAGVRAIINCQKRGEHASCGDGNLPCGFSYDPESFMSRGVYFYNFSWKDMTAPKTDLMLEIVQVMDFTISAGAKVAVHCHAGRGRTGLCIASYLMYADPDLDPTRAIAMVREKRPGSVQTRYQEIFAETFHTYLRSLRIVFHGAHKATLAQHLRAQGKLLHGWEKRRGKYVPKVVDQLCQRMERLAHEGHAAAESCASALSRVPSGGSVSLGAAATRIMDGVNKGRYALIETCDDPGDVADLLHVFLQGLKDPLVPVTMRSHILEAHPAVDLLSRLPNAQLLTILRIIRMARVIIGVGIGSSAWVAMCEGLGVAITGAESLGSDPQSVLGHFTRAVIEDWHPPMHPSIKYIMADHGDEEDLSPLAVRGQLPITK